MAVKIYEPELKILVDIMKTNKMILDCMVDISETLSRETIPDLIKKNVWQACKK